MRPSNFSCHHPFGTLAGLLMSLLKKHISIETKRRKVLRALKLY
jgi:hypothetical protein